MASDNQSSFEVKPNANQSSESDGRSKSPRQEAWRYEAKAFYRRTTQPAANFFESELDE